MIKTIIAVILIFLAMICVGSTVYEFIAAKGEMGIFSADVLGAAAFHGICMIIASFLLATKKEKNTVETVEE